jgi:Rrf2 family protein
MLSQKARYALRAVLMMAERAPEDTPLTVPEIAEHERIPRKFLEAILVELRDKGIVESRRGRYGGYKLARPPAEVSFGQVIRDIDGPLAPVLCASRTRFTPCDDCADVATCTIRWVMVKARDAIAATLDGCSLADALAQPERLKVGLAASDD